MHSLGALATRPSGNSISTHSHTSTPSRTPSHQPTTHRFDRLVKTKYPANVLSGFEATAGATFFNLNDLQVGLCLWLCCGWDVFCKVCLCRLCVCMRHELAHTAVTCACVPSPDAAVMLTVWLNPAGRVQGLSRVGHYSR